MKIGLCVLAGCFILQFCCITASSEEQDANCESNADCNYNAKCHPVSKMCICKNGQTNYPACMQSVPTHNNCKDQCQDFEYCDSNGVCQCKWGGMSRTNCCRSECKRLQSCVDGQCKCKYGEYSRGSRRGRCRSCKRFCERERGYCHHKQRKCKCKRGYEGRFPKCRKEESSESTEKKEECPNQCGPGGRCIKVDGRIICIDCGPGYEHYKSQCRKIPVWADWGAWSDCSVTCGSGTSKRERNCIPPEGDCKGGSGEETKECEASKACSVNCSWCEWSQWSQHTCNRQRNRSPECPARKGVGTECAGDDQETSHGNSPLLPTDRVCDFQRIVNSVFEVWCQNGCIEITKVVHDCLGNHKRASLPDELKRVRDVCQGKSHCRLTPDSTFFDRVPACQNRNRPAQTWIYWRCVKGTHLPICLNGQLPPGVVSTGWGRSCILFFCFGR